MEKENLLNEEENISVNARGGGGTYEDFNPNDPYNEANNFKPAFCLNFKTGEVWFGGGKAKINADGSGYLANKKINWDKDGNLTLNFGERKIFKKFDIDDYDFNNAFKVDLSDGLNFYFTKNKDNDPRTIILPSNKELEGYEVEMDFDGNPGLITIKCDSNYVIRYNGSYVNEIRIGHYPRRLKLVARKTYQLLSSRCEWWIDNAAEFKMSSDGTFAGTFRSI